MSRELILARLRRARTEGLKSAAIEPAPPKPSPDNLIERFAQGMQANHASLIRCSAENWPRHLAQLAQQRRLQSWLLGTGHPQLTAAETALSSLAEVWRFEHAVEQLHDRLFRVDASFTLCAGASAEPAALWLRPDPNEPRSLSLIPPVHVVLLYAQQIVADLPALLEDRRPSSSQANRLLISGPSKTADIQQTLAYGAHGPRELIILLVED